MTVQQTTQNQTYQQTQPAQPAQPVQPAKPAPKPSVGMPKLPSLNMAQVTETPAPAEEPTQPKEGPQNTPFTRDRLLTVWAGLKAHFPKEDRLQRMLTDYTPVITGDNMLTLTLANPWQKEEFGSFGKQIMTIVRKELQNDLVKLQVTVAAFDKSKQAYTAAEKYKVLAKQNAVLADLKTSLNLQLE